MALIPEVHVTLTLQNIAVFKRRLEPARQPLRGELVPSGPLSDKILHKLGRLSPLK